MHIVFGSYSLLYMHIMTLWLMLIACVCLACVHFDFWWLIIYVWCSCVFDTYIVVVTTSDIMWYVVWWDKHCLVFCMPQQSVHIEAMFVTGQFAILNMMCEIICTIYLWMHVIIHILSSDTQYLHVYDTVDFDDV